MNKNIADVAIIGCGWLGLPLAERLVKNGLKVAGTTTSAEKISELSNLGIDASLFRLGETSWDEIPLAHIYFINIPPSGVQSYVQNIGLLAQHLPKSATNILFCSTTSVYADEDGVEVSEEVVAPGAKLSSNEPNKARHGTARQDLIDAEGAFWELGNTTILRLAGLYGGDRHPVRYLSGRNNLGKPDAPVNLVHRDDILEIATKIIAAPNAFINEVFNISASEHPSRKEYYTDVAKKKQITPPHFDDQDTSGGKIISAKKIEQRFGVKILLRE
jgi:nucleoside-diphosphate-sugar epimerase